MCGTSQFLVLVTQVQVRAGCAQITCDMAEVGSSDSYLLLASSRIRSSMMCSDCEGNWYIASRPCCVTTCYLLLVQTSVVRCSKDHCTSLCTMYVVIGSSWVSQGGQISSEAQREVVSARLEDSPRPLILVNLSPTLDLFLTANWQSPKLRAFAARTFFFRRSTPSLRPPFRQAVCTRRC